MAGRSNTAGKIRNMPEPESHRLFLCDLCSRQVSICKSCDRGNRYCSSVCSHTARREAQRAAKRRYQSTPRGRELHRARQARYRSRQRVTDQGCFFVPKGASEGSERVPEPQKQQPAPFCCACGAGPIVFYRLAALSWSMPAKERRRRSSRKSALRRRKTAVFDRR